jgi:hypothetical protein
MVVSAPIAGGAILAPFSERVAVDVAPWPVSGRGKPVTKGFDFRDCDFGACRLHPC